MFTRKRAPLSLEITSQRIVPIADAYAAQQQQEPEPAPEPDPVNDILEAGLAEITQQRKHFDNMPTSQRHAELTAQMIGAFEAKEAELDADRKRVEFELLETRKTLAAYRHANAMLTGVEIASDPLPRSPEAE